MTEFKIGVSKQLIKFDADKRYQMQGYADPSQKTTTVMRSDPLWARAFVIDDGNNIVAIVIVDFWGCTWNIKSEVIELLKKESETRFRPENLLIAGTHTHSAPGEYSSWGLFCQPDPEVNSIVLVTYTEAIKDAILGAIKNLDEGEIKVAKGQVEDCGGNRSPEAYDENPIKERDEYEQNTDTEMLLLLFVRTIGDEQVPIGCLNWFPIHPTDLGQKNTAISGDNKGLASHLLESEIKKETGKSFVAAFANSNAGDVSGNVRLNVPPSERNKELQEENLKHNAEAQEKAAKQLIDIAKSSESLNISLAYWYGEFTIASQELEDDDIEYATFPYALGFSFAAGSTVDSDPKFRGFFDEVDTLEGAEEGVNKSNIKVRGKRLELAAWGTMMAAVFGTPIPATLAKSIKDGHGEKPILFYPGDIASIVPEVLPLQCIKIGGVAIVGFPGELTTMAGRRLRDTVKASFDEDSIDHVALNCYANDYCQYVTTREEYEAQYYEGASVPFGPDTLNIFQDSLYRLIKEIEDGLYIDCYSFSSLDRYFTVSYKGLGGTEEVVLKSGEPNNTPDSIKAIRFVLPRSGIKDIKVGCGYKPTFNPWQLTNILNVPHEFPDKVYKVHFADESITGVLKNLQNVKIWIENACILGIADITITYTDADTGEEKSESKNLTYLASHTFDISTPKNSISVTANVKFGNVWRSTNTSVKLDRGQTFVAKVIHYGFEDKVEFLKFNEEQIEGVAPGKVIRPISDRSAFGVRG